MKPFQGTHRYELLNHLGSGTFGEVYEVFDRERKIKVALKRPHEMSADSLYYFKREFRALADATHPNLVELYELVAEEDNWFFTMELVSGEQFTRVLRQRFLKSAPKDTHAQQMNYDLLRDLLRQLAEGLLALHRARKLHRDIKPSNVLVTLADHVVILDFGLSADFSIGDTEDTLTTRIVGTPAYMAPEQLNGYRGTKASDWYSVGVMLYETITGRLPFGGGSVQEMTRAKLEEDPRPPSEWIDDIPEDLEDICLGLLQRSPSTRLGGDGLLKRLSSSPAFHSKPSESLQPSSLFVGRSFELTTLFEAFAEVKTGRSTLLHLHGGSGTGKTQLLRHFVETIRRSEPNAVILQGRCYAQESVPYKALDPLIDDMSRYLMRLPIEKAEILAPRNSQALARLFPILNRVDSFRLSPRRSVEAEDAKSILRRASLALRELLGRLCEVHPVLIVIDDLQWGDYDSIHLIRDLLSPPDPPALMLVACYRTEEASTSPALLELLSSPTGAHSSEIALHELSRPNAESLALSLIGPDVSNAHMLAERVAKDSGGNPFYVCELAHHVRFRHLTSAIPGEVNLFSCILQRLSSLPEKTRRIVEVLAIAGHPLSWTMVKATLQAEEDCVPPPTLFKAGRLLRARNTPAQTLEIYHDFVRCAVLSSMGDLHRRQLHLLLAEAMEAAGCTEPETLAQHYLQADRFEKAAEWTAIAADRAAASLAFKNAAELYRQSLFLRKTGDPLIPALLLHLAQALSNAGLSKEAAETYLQLASVITNAESLTFQRRAAEEYFRCGQIDLGLATIRPLLASNGMTLPTTKIGLKLANGFFSLLLRLRGHGFVKRSEQDIPASDLEKLDICWAAVQGIGTGALMTGMDLQVRHLLLALKVGEPSRIIRALAHQTYLEAIHDGDQRRHRTQFYDSLSITLAEQHGDPKLIGYAYLTSGMAAFLQGRWSAAEESLTRSKSVYTEKCIGVAAELHQVQRNLIHIQMILGKVEEVNQTLPGLVQDAQDRGDILAEANLMTSYYIWTFLMRDDLKGARACLARAREICSSENFHSQNWQLIYSGGAVEQYAGNPVAHWNSLEQHRKEFEQSRMLDVEYIRLAWCEHVARISISYARSCPDGSSEKRLALETAQPAIQALRPFKSTHYRATYAKLRALDSEARGTREETLKWLHRAEVHYNNLSMPIHAHSAQWCRGTLMGLAGKDLVEGAETWMRALGIVNPGRYANSHVPCTDFDDLKR